MFIGLETGALLTYLNLPVQIPSLHKCQAEHSVQNQVFDIALDMLRVYLFRVSGSDETKELNLRCLFNFYVPCGFGVSGGLLFLALIFYCGDEEEEL